MAGWVKQIDPGDLVASARAAAGTWCRYASPPDGMPGLVFGLGRLQPGESLSHAHREEEVFYVLSGTGEAVWTGADGIEQRAELVPGRAFWKAGQVVHTLRATGPEPLVGLYAKA